MKVLINIIAKSSERSDSFGIGTASNKNGLKILFVFSLGTKTGYDGK